MGDSTAAARQRRYRAHKRGDHSLCDPARCNPSGAVTVTASVTRDAVTTPPGLGVRGQRLWRDLVDDDESPWRPAERVLAEEACRIADRLERLDALLRGDVDTWVRILDEDGREATVVVDRVLSEARQQQIALKQLVAELRASRAEVAGKAGRGMGGQARTSGTGARQPAGKGGGGVVRDLTSRIAGRRNPTAG